MLRFKAVQRFQVVSLFLSMVIGSSTFADSSDTHTMSNYPSCPEKIEPDELPLFYPNLMAIDSTSGEVILRFVINKLGNTQNIVILSSSGGRNERAFRRSALKMVSERKYLPIKTACLHTETVSFDMGG